ncbi:MAG: hypothetical protein IJW77_07220 [Clostridia bacterium]|nr:hypothetical protein [Clostridia bacterium]
MKRVRFNGNGMLALLINLLLHLEWSIPAWILLILHFLIGLSVLWFWAALAAWICGILLWSYLVGRLYGWANRCADTPDPPKKNVNPYSVGNDKHSK